MAVIPFGEWKPDVSSYGAGHGQNINNVWPRGDGYGPIPNLSPFTDALPAACRGAFLALDDDATIAIFAGTSTRIYKLDNSNLAWGDVSKADTAELSYSGSTNIGNLTDAGGLVAAFDGTTAQAAAACAAKTASTTAYVGKTLAAAEPIHSVKIYGSNNAGYVSTINPNVTATLYGKTGSAPSTGTDGTAISAGLTFADSADEHVARTITSTNTTSQWNHVWVYFTHDGAANTINVAELEFFGANNYTLASGSQWQFAQSGTDVIAVVAGNAPQRYTLGSSSNFANLGGSPPNAAYITTINDRVILSGLDSYPYRIMWSARADITGWTAGTNGADVEDFLDGGIVRGVAGGEWGWVFQDGVIRRMTYVAGDLGFEFDRLTEDRGLKAPYSLVRGGDCVYFLSPDGFCKLDSGGGITPIGREKFDRTFFSEWDSGNMQLMQGAYDSRYNRIYWFYKTATGSTSGLFNRGIVYDPTLQRAAYINGISGECVTTLATPGVTLDGLDSIGFSSIDAMTISLDDFPPSTNIGLSIFDSSHQAGYLSGSNLEAVLETPMSADTESYKRYRVRQIRHDTDSATAYGSVFHRQKLTDNETQSAEVLMNSVGYSPHLVDGRIVKIRQRIPSGTTWSFSVGVEPDLVLTGKR